MQDWGGGVDRVGALQAWVQSLNRPVVVLGDFVVFLHPTAVVLGAYSGFVGWEYVSLKF